MGTNVRDKQRKRKRWWSYGGVGAALLGFGLCCTVESGFLKHNGEPWYIWVIAGTLSLCLAIAGTIFLIKAGILGNELENEK